MTDTRNFLEKMHPNFVLLRLQQQLELVKNMPIYKSNYSVRTNTVSETRLLLVLYEKA